MSFSAVWGEITSIGGASSAWGGRGRPSTALMIRGASRTPRLATMLIAWRSWRGVTETS
ncbi:MAG: hypothetical protein BWX98_02482 [Candidatus Aminicenantes bacterium ADurb.Bin147]|nr:MAG: hypothetical protein BWX98_02482 [Candidatus Aminicenantes bacterium ADurb.Bin147]